MARIRPFRAVRPTADKVHLVASRSYVTYTPAKLKDKLDYNPYSFIHIINPEHRQRRKSRPNSDKRFHKVREKYHQFMDEGVFFKDEKPSFYIYRQIHHGHSHTGIISGVAVDDYLQGDICIHEQTLGPREEVFRRYLDITGFNAEPVLLTYEEEDDALDRILEPWMEAVPLYDFSTTDKARHQLWRLDEEHQINKLTEFFSEVKKLYIADGHHRSASSVLLAQEKREKGESPTALWNYMMAYILPSHDLLMHPFHRLVRTLEMFDEGGFIEALREHFIVELMDGPAIPSQRRQFCLYLDGRWYNAMLKKGSNVFNDEETDAQMLTDVILKPLLDIIDIRHDDRVDFVGGEDKILELKSKVDRGWFAAGFILHPANFEDMKRVCDAGQTMPPKSTYIEPKLRSGLTIFELNDED